MNKLIFGLLLLVTQGVWAQLDWKDLDEDYKKLYVLAERVSEQTNQVIVGENATSVGIVKGEGVLKIDRVAHKLKTNQKNHFKYYFGSSASDSRLLLDKIATEKVIRKYTDYLSVLKEELNKNRDAKVDKLLNNLFGS